MTLNMIDKSPTCQIPGKSEYEIYSDLSQIEGIGCDWKKLLAASSCNKAFGSMEWYLASCRVQSSLVPYLGIALCGPEIICILPLALNPDTGVAFFPHLENDYNDLLVRGDNPEPVAGLIKYAMSSASACRQMILSKLKPDSPCLQAAISLNSNSSIKHCSRDANIYHYIELPLTFEDYLASRGKLFRRNVRRALRNEGKHGLVIQELYPTSFNPAELPEIFIRLILSRHNGRCAFRDERAQSFIRELLPAVFRNGSMRVFAIFEEERITAIDLYLVTGRGLVAWNGGFLAEMEPLSPGTALIAFAIRQAIAMGLQELDFGEGDEAYKRNWTNNSYLIRELTLVPAVLQEHSNEY